MPRDAYNGAVFVRCRGAVGSTLIGFGVRSGGLRTLRGGRLLVDFCIFGENGGNKGKKAKH